MKIYEFAEVEETVNPEDVDLSSFDVHDELNPDFWPDGKIEPEVRRTLLRIARDFIVDLDLKNVRVEDIVITGSIANYNWDSEHSDVDLHIIVDFSKICDDIKLLKNYLDSAKKIWNEKHEDLTIHGFPVEIYVQDVKEKHMSSGVFSVLKNDWVTEPVAGKLTNDTVDEDKVKASVSDFMNELEELEDSLDSSEEYDECMEIYDAAGDLFDRIKQQRSSGLGTKGSEMSTGNIIFKTLRRNGTIERIFDLKVKSYDKANSLE